MAKAKDVNFVLLRDDTASLELRRNRDGSLTGATERGETASIGCEPNAFGILLKACRSVVPVSTAFQPGTIGYLRNLAGHRRRIRRELKRIFEESVQADDTDRPLRRGGTSGAPKGGMRIVDGMVWDDLKTVSCARCEKVLLGESMRAVVKTLQKPTRSILQNMKNKQILSTLPPLLECRLYGVPYCTICSQKPPVYKTTST